jgi:hypothetical protein
MADFDLTQTDAQVQSILNDAQNAQGAGAQTTLTTDYIMLKDTSGNYHKILKDSFTEACRNVLAGLLVNNDKGTTISQIPAIASGDFGSVTPANLASVLGAAQTEITDFNAAPTGLSYCGNIPGASNAPSITGPQGVVITTKRSDGIRGAQTVLATSGNFAVRFLGGSGYEPWVVFPEFYKNYSTLAGLASALGVKVQEQLLSANGTWNIYDEVVDDNAVFSVESPNRGYCCVFIKTYNNVGIIKEQGLDINDITISIYNLKGFSIANNLQTSQYVRWRRLL